jgi:isochorismate synthase EntC
VALSEVVSALHPTPAVGGVPRDRALRFLAEHEDLDRGWYAGPVGWVGDGAAELAVAIRSAMFRGGQADLFVGAGVVAGSTAEGEWLETEAKSFTLLEAIGDRVGSG